MIESKVLVIKNFSPPTTKGIHYRILCMTGKYKGTSYYLKSNRIILGRGDGADIQVMDTQSSREHAEIVKSGDKYIITDLASHNGIIVNDLKITQHILNDGDKIIIGHTVFKYNLLNITSSLEEKKKALIAIAEEYDNDENNKNGNEENNDDNNNQTKNIKLPKLPRNKNPSNLSLMRKFILGIVAAGMMMLIIFDNESDTKNDAANKKEDTQYNGIASGNEYFNQDSKKQQTPEDKENSERIAIIMSRGQRELREGNYFRAISEFELAQALDNNSRDANTYKEITQKSLNDLLEKESAAGQKNIDSIKYSQAIINFCYIIRTLEKYPNSPAHKNAIEKLNYIEQKMGMEKNEIKCFYR